MKLTKLSLVAALAVSAAFAGGDIAPVEPVAEAPAPAAAATVASDSTVTGNVKLWYGTNDAGSNDLFSQGGAFGDAYADIKYSRKVMDNVTLNLGVAALSTLGLENELVSSTWANHGTDGVKDAFWVNEANVVVGLPSVSSFLKIGRQELDTPFFYSEKWNIATNTFDAAVFGNTSLPDTTLVAAWVGRGNGAPGTVVALENTSINGGHKAFTGASKPAYAFAAINKSLPGTTLSAWYYKIPSIAQAYWLQADAGSIMDTGLGLGLQYAGTKLTGSGAKTSAYGAKLSFAISDFDLYGAYTKRDDKAGIDISNIATGHSQNGSESRLYTEAYWNYGYVGAQDAKSFAIGASYDLGMAKLGAQYTDVDALANHDLQEFALTASAKLGPVNADLAYINATKDDANNGDSDNTVLIMLSMPYSL
jgi:hypothetical protein